MARTPQPTGTYARVTAHLYESLSQLPADDALRAVLLPRIASAIIDTSESQVSATEPAQRLAKVLEALRDEGLSYYASFEDGAVVLRRIDCHWSRLVGDSETAVAEERRILAALLGTEASQIVHDGVKFVYRSPQAVLQP
jgi:predicted ArsR family transcriptional regulator